MEHLANDLLAGAREIAQETGFSVRKVYDLAEAGYLPTFKLGGKSTPVAPSCASACLRKLKLPMQQKPHLGTPGVHGSEPGEPNKPAPEPPDPVRIFAPWCDNEERALRLRIHKARDIAQARACRSKHGRARAIYWTAAQLSGAWVFQRVSTEELGDILEALTRLFLVAGTIERLEAPDAN